jgi:hypothetical protein
MFYHPTDTQENDLNICKVFLAQSGLKIFTPATMQRPREGDFIAIHRATNFVLLVRARGKGIEIRTYRKWTFHRQTIDELRQRTELSIIIGRKLPLQESNNFYLLVAHDQRKEYEICWQDTRLS